MDRKRSRGGGIGSFLSRLARFILLVCLSFIAFGLGVAVQGYLFLSAKIPSIERFKNYEPCIPTQIFADNGQLIGEFYLQRRYAVPVREMPRALLDAFVAAEGPDFWKPRGLDTKAIVNAALNMIKAPRSTSGVGTLPLSRPDRGPKDSFVRTVKEAILYNRIERALTKEEIFYLYQNQIYLGSCAYGVEAAARTYLGKSAKDMTVAQCAMIAGLAKSPVRYSPKRHMQTALGRRNHVLQRMYDGGKITKEDFEKATREKLVVVETKVELEKARSDYLRGVRGYIENKYGSDALYKGSLRVYTSVQLPWTEAAQECFQEPTVCIKRIVDRRGKVLEEHGPSPEASEKSAKNLVLSDSLLHEVLLMKQTGALHEQ